MKITPALPNPQQPAPQARQGVGAVQPSKPAADVLEQTPRRNLSPRAVDAVEREQLAARVDARIERDPHATLRATRAVSAYHQVASDGERNELRDLLGFDDYA